MVSAVASLDVRCVYTVPRVEDDGSGYGCGWVVSWARGVGGTTTNVGEAMQKALKKASREETSAGVRARRGKLAVVVRSRR
jgi:hypothetical protein